jgi:uroporphyrinogen decarboxylase
MAKKDDLVAAFECRQPAGAVPIWELHFHCWDQASGKHFVGRPEFDSLSSREQTEAISRNADIIVEVAERLHFAGVSIPDPPWDCYYTLPPEARIELARILRKRARNDFMVIASCPGIIGMPGSEEYVEFSCKLFDAPEEIDDRARKSLARGIETAKRLRDAGVEGVYSGADIADNRGPWFSPEQLDRFIYPYLRDWASAIRSFGMYAIQHTDGDITPLLPELARTGIHAVQAVDPVAGMDIARAKGIVNGRLCLCGNVDCGMLILGSNEEIFAAPSA